jgi:hypothetical protein
MIHSIYREDELIVALNGVPYVIDIDDYRYESICEALEEKDEEALENLLSTKRRAASLVNNLAEEGIEESFGCYTYKGNPIDMDLSEYLRAALDSSDVMPIVKFIQRLFKNPSQDTRDRLFVFMEKNKMPIDENGHFLAFKGVASNYFDKHTGTVYNGPGVTVPLMEWDEVDTNPNNTCSRGYHACSKDYLDGWVHTGDRVVAVSIDPANVASIPIDYDGAKLRCRQYTVLNDITDQYMAEKQETILRTVRGLNVLGDSPVSYVRRRDFY